jgi:hypothetical protein
MESRGAESADIAFSTVPCDQFYAPVTPRKLPRKEAVSVVHDTPTHNRLSSIVPQTSTNVFIERPFVEAAEEMKGKFWGPVSVKEFFNNFLSVDTSSMPKINLEAVKDVANQKLETAMYDPLVNLSFCLFEHVLI